MHFISQEGKIVMRVVVLNAVLSVCTDVAREHSSSNSFKDDRKWNDSFFSSLFSRCDSVLSRPGFRINIYLTKVRSSDVNIGRWGRSVESFEADQRGAIPIEAPVIGT